MRRLISCLILVSTLIFAGEAFFFQDVVVYETEVEDGYVLPDGVDVITTDADSWWIEDRKVNWNDIIRSSKLELVDELPKGFYTLVNLNPPVLKRESDYFVFLSSAQRWFRFKPGKIESGRILRAPDVSEAILVGPGTWKARYTFTDEKELTLNVFVRSPLMDEANVSLVTGNFRKVERPILRSTRAPVKMEGFKMEVEKVYERKVYSIGEIEGIKKGVWKKVFEGFVSDVKRFYTFSFGVNSGNIFHAKTRLVLEMENTAENGLGFPLPDGEVVIFKTSNGRTVPVGTYEVEGANVGGVWRILEDETRDVTVNVKTISSRKNPMGKIVRKIEVEVENYKEDSVTVKITVLGRMMKLLSSDITPSEESANGIVFEFDVNPGTESFKFEIESRW